MLSLDELCLLFMRLRLGHLTHLKAVCKSWANGARRTIHSPQWKEIATNRATLQWVPERFCQYETAEQAFASLGVGNKLDKRLVTRKVKQLAQIHGVGLRGFYRADDVTQIFFSNSIGLFSKTVRIAQQNDSDRICFFSDVYHVDTNKINTFALKCVNAGMEVCVFEKDYPGLEFSSRYGPPRGIKLVSMGYQHFYRGKLIGIVV